MSIEASNEDKIVDVSETMTFEIDEHYGDVFQSYKRQFNLSLGGQNAIILTLQRGFTCSLITLKQQQMTMANVKIFSGQRANSEKLCCATEMFLGL